MTNLHQAVVDYAIWEKEFFDAMLEKLYLTKEDLDGHEEKYLVPKMKELWRQMEIVRMWTDKIADSINFSIELGREPKWVVINTIHSFGTGMGAAYRADNILSLLLAREVHPVQTKYVYLYTRTIAEFSVRHDDPLPPFIEKEIARYLNGEESWSIDRWINGDDRFCQLLTTEQGIPITDASGNVNLVT